MARCETNQGRPGTNNRTKGVEHLGRTDGNAEHRILFIYRALERERGGKFWLGIKKERVSVLPIVFGTCICVFTR